MKKLGLALALCSQLIQAASLEEIRARDYIQVGVRNQLKGFGYLKDGAYDGFEIEMARQIAKRIFGDESKIKFIPVSGAQRITVLKNNEVDLVMAYFVINHQRRKAVDFGEPYMNVYLGALNHDNQNVQQNHYFQNKKVLVLDSGSADIYFRHIHPDVETVKCKNYEGCFKAFANHEADVFVNDFNVLNLMSELYRKTTDGIQLLDHIDYQEYIAPAVDKGNKELLQLVNEEMKSMKQDGRLKAYFDAKVSPVIHGFKAEDLLILK